jgi:hypothetical protein
MFCNPGSGSRLTAYLMSSIVWSANGAQSLSYLGTNWQLCDKAILSPFHAVLFYPWLLGCTCVKMTDQISLASGRGHLRLATQVRKCLHSKSHELYHKSSWPNQLARWNCVAKVNDQKLFFCTGSNPGGAILLFVLPWFFLARFITTGQELGADFILL